LTFASFVCDGRGIYESDADTAMPGCCASLFTADPKNTSSGSSPDVPARRIPQTQDVAVFSSDWDTASCVTSLPRDPAIRGEKGRFAYSLTVVHFRKLRNSGKIGSGRKGGTVI